MSTESELPPVVGTLEEYSESPFERRREWAQEGDVLRIAGPEEDHHMVLHPDDVEDVLFDQSNFKKFGGYESVFGRGMVSVYGDQWRAQRGTLQPAFQPVQVEAYVDRVRGVLAEYRDKLEDGKTFDARSLMTDLTMEVMLDALFGGADEYMDTIGAATQDITDWFLESATAGPIPEDVQTEFEDSIDELSAVVDEMIERREADRSSDDLLSILLAVGPDSDADYGDERIRDEMITMFFGAHETTSLTLTYTLYLLADAPEVTQKLTAEVDEVVDTAVPSSDHLDELTYTEQVVDESLRTYSPAHSIFRVARNDVDIGGYTIPAGDVIYLPECVIHHDSRWWDDPEEFRPERFAGDDDRPTCAYFPFGVGPRRCIGEQFARAESKMVVATMFDEYTFDRVTEEFERHASLSAVPDRPIELTARRRE
jgi:cytochrome P450